MRRFIHGHLGKMVYRDEFKELPKTDEEKRQELLDKMKPWKFDPKRPIFVGGKAGGGIPPITDYLLTAQGDALQTAGGDNLVWTI